MRSQAQPLFLSIESHIMKNALFISVKLLATLLLSLAVQISTSRAEEVDARIGHAMIIPLSVGINGEVKRVNVSSGDRVKAGDILLEIDNDYFKEQY